MRTRYELSSDPAEQPRLIQRIGQLQGLLDAVVECAMPSDINVDPEEFKFADWCLTRAMQLAKALMEETEVRDNGASKQ